MDEVLWDVTLCRWASGSRRLVIFRVYDHRKRQEPLTQQQSVTSHQTWILSHAGLRTPALGKSCPMRGTNRIFFTWFTWISCSVFLSDCQYHSTKVHTCLVFMLLLSEGGASETWNLQVRQCSSGNRKRWKQKYSHFSSCLKRITTLRSW